MNLLLHHLVGSSDRATLALQSKAISQWRQPDKFVFINEYIYESYLPGYSSWLIYQITSSQLLSSICRLISKVIPAFKANTFGVGVRFRSDSNWRRIFKETGFDIAGFTVGEDERIALPLRLLFIKAIKRNSYLLKPAA